jgi:hypothetical protein
MNFRLTMTAVYTNTEMSKCRLLSKARQFWWAFLFWPVILVSSDLQVYPTKKELLSGELTEQRQSMESGPPVDSGVELA